MTLKTKRLLALLVALLLAMPTLALSEGSFDANGLDIEYEEVAEETWVEETEESAEEPSAIESEELPLGEPLEDPAPVQETFVQEPGLVYGTEGAELVTDTIDPAMDGAEHTHTVDGSTITFIAWTDALAAEQNGPEKTAANSLPRYGGNYYLTKDVNLGDDCWFVTEGTVNLCLNGCTITSSSDFYTIDIASALSLFDDAENKGTITNSHEEGIGVLVLGSTFNMYGGNISGISTTAYNGGGVKVYGSSTFNMYGGNISGNTSTVNGGGVSVENTGTFNMYGGTISKNTALEGGGVYVDEGCTFNLTGGTISENTAQGNGGGVFLKKDGTFTVSGTPQITTNKVGQETSNTSPRA